MKIFKKILEFLLPIAIGLAIGLFIINNLFTIVKVNGPSMEPNLQDKQSLMLLRKANIKRNSVIVFDAKKIDPQANGQSIDYVKRVIGIPGDSVKYTNKGQLIVNNKNVTQNYIKKDQKIDGTLIMNNEFNNGFTLNSLSQKNNWTYKANSDNTIPKGYYFVMGDHRSVSNDGRYWGLVPKDQVLGVVKAFPWQSNHQIVNGYK